MEVYMNSLEATSPPISINSLPDEILVQIFSNLSPKDLAEVAPICNLWNKIATEELTLYKNAKLRLHYQIFRDMTNLIQPSEKNVTLMKIIEEKILSEEIFSEEFVSDSIFFQPILPSNSPSKVTKVKNKIVSGFNGLKSTTVNIVKSRKSEKKPQIEVESEAIVEQDFYKKLMNALVEITRTNKTNVLALEYPSKRESKYSEFAKNSLSRRLFNVIYTANSEMSLRIASCFVNQKLNTLILSRSVSKNPEALEQLRFNVSHHQLLSTVKLSEVSIVEGDNPNYSAIGPISKVLTAVSNLKNILINEFQMTDLDAIDLAELMKSKETLERCEIFGEGNLTNEGLGYLSKALRDREFETAFNFKFSFHSEENLREGLTELQSLDRRNFTVTLEKIGSEL